MTRPLRQLSGIFALLLLITLASCSTEIDTPGERLRIFDQSLDPAFIGESYSDNIEVIGGLSPYNYEVSRGQLPPGLALQGATLRGTPSEAGTFTFTVSISDANLSETFEEYTLEVSVPPPATLNINVPETEMSEVFTVPVSISDARELRAFRTLLTWDASRFELVPNSVRATRGRVVLLQNVEEGELNVDVAFLGDPLSDGGRIFTFDLRPLEPSTVEVTARTEFRAANEDFAFTEVTAGTAPDSFDDGEDVTGGSEDGFEEDLNTEDGTDSETDDGTDNGEDD